MSPYYSERPILPAPSHITGPGRLSLKLFRDLCQYDPKLGRRNLYSLPPDEQYKLEQLPPSDHTHRFIKIPSYKPTKDGPSDLSYSSSDLELRAMCKTCRIGVKLQVQQKPGPATGSTNCHQLKPDRPCHHYIYDANGSIPCSEEVVREKPDSWVDKRVFQCSSYACSHMVEITITPAKVTASTLEHLLDPKKKAERLQHAKDKDERISRDQEVPSNYDVLKHLLKYIRNVVGGKRQVPIGNMVFLQYFGDDCLDMMETFGYIKSTDEKGTPVLKPRAFPDLKVYDILQLELSLLVTEEGQRTGEPVEFDSSRHSADEQMRKMLGCDYEKYGFQIGLPDGSMSSPVDLDTIDGGSKDRPIDLTSGDSKFYRGLGICHDHIDKLVFHAFKRQKQSDTDKTPLYYECFLNIASARDTDELNMELAKLQSENYYTETELKAAYDTLNVEEVNDDNLIVTVFRSLLESDRSKESHLREQLAIIGRHRNSDMIKKAAERNMTTVEQAYAYLEVPADATEDFIQAMYAVKRDDKPDEILTTKDALKLIAETRNSEFLLKYWKEECGLIPKDSGRTMSVEEAYTLLGVAENRSADDEILINAYKVMKQDAPHREQELFTALKTIGEHRQSIMIHTVLGIQQSDNTTRPRDHNWPVGLENIGNTCYLNSLLQFYFTIKPLRKRVIEFDSYQEVDMTEELLQRKRVGGRLVSAEEIQRAKNFVSHLRTLFSQLETSTQSSITPEKELAYLALVSVKDERERAMLPAPNTESDETMPDLVPLGADMDIDGADSTVSTVKENVSVRSEETLVGDVISGERQAEDFVMVDSKTVGEETIDLGIAKDVPVESSDEGVEILETPSASIDTVMEGVKPQEPTLSNEGTSGNAPVQAVGSLENEDAVMDDASPRTPPRKPPPIPPRPQPAKPIIDIDSSFMFGRQQDVTECIENVMFQLEAAIKPDDFDENGEQLDFVKKLFYGKTKQALQAPGGERRDKEEYFSHLIVNVAGGNQDIYSALDSSFDASTVDLEGAETRRYVSISELPPILQIQIQRVQYDREKKSAYKSTAKLSFPETIYMDRYMESVENVDLLKRREEAWEWKSEISKLEKRKEELTVNDAQVDVPNALSLSAEHLSNLTSDPQLNLQDPQLPQLLATLDSASSSTAEELSQLDSQIRHYQSRLAQQFTDLRSQAYRVHSVFIHRGTASAGHYWIYIYDYAEQRWRKYNDGYVTEVVDEKEVFGGENGATPYLVVFVREDLVGQLCESVAGSNSGEGWRSPKKRKTE